MRKCLQCGKDITAIYQFTNKDWCSRKCEDEYNNTKQSCSVVEDLLGIFNDK